MLGEGGLEPLPRRKTVGFHDDKMHRKLTISEVGDGGESRHQDNTTVIQVDDIDDSKQSQSIFDKASEFNLQTSIARDESQQELAPEK